MKIAGIFHNSVVDGPGVRDVIFFQGCRHNCEGCHNPTTWNFNYGKDYSVKELIHEIEKNSYCDKITISGGDAFYQEIELIQLVKNLKLKDYNIMLYTGFLYEDIKNSPVLDYIDILVDGPFILNLRTLDIPFVGSSNQRKIDIPRTKLERKIITI